MSEETTRILDRPPEPIPRWWWWFGWVFNPMRDPGRAILLIAELTGIALTIAVGLAALFLIALGCYSMVAIAP